MVVVSKNALTTLYFKNHNGLAWLGLAWLGLAWLGLAWLGAKSLVSFKTEYKLKIKHQELTCV